MAEVWLFYIISAVVLWAVTTIIDKIALTKHVNAFSYLVTYTPLKIIIIVGVLLFSGINSTLPHLLAFLAGVIAVFGYYAYAYAMKGEEASRIAGLTSLYPAVVAVLAAIFINEVFPLKSYLGIAMMIIGTILISQKSSKIHKMIPFAIVTIALISSLIYGIEQIMSKISLGSIDTWPFLASYFIGNLTATLLSLSVPYFRNNLVKELRSLNKRTFMMLESASVGWTTAIIFFFYAASLGPITLVSTIGITTPLAVLLLAIALSKFWPNVFKEEIDHRTLAFKFFGIAFVSIGTWLILV
ncbi:hypothetical protein EPN87_02455 [archaeon]|nr:MAG: hypothetical protein EPN87_02455 [archaeon]